MKSIHEAEAEAHKKYQRAEEKADKVMNQLKLAYNRMHTLCSLYTDVLACRCPAKNYALFLLEIYLQLKIKAVREGKSIDLKKIDDFMTCYKLYGVKVQRLMCEFYLHNLILENDIETNPSLLWVTSNTKHLFHLMLIS